MTTFFLLLTLLLTPPLLALLAGSRPPLRRNTPLLKAEGRSAGKSAPRQRWPVERFFKTALFFRRRDKPSVYSPLLRSLVLEDRESPALPMLRYALYSF